MKRKTLDKTKKTNRMSSTNTQITDDKQVYDRSSLIRYMKYLYVSKMKDDKVIDVNKPWQTSAEGWANHTISHFLDAMLSGAGYDSADVADGEPFDIHDTPENPYAFFAYLLAMGKIYE